MAGVVVAQGVCGVAKHLTRTAPEPALLASPVAATAALAIGWAISLAFPKPR